MLTYLRRKKKKGGNNNINKIKLNKTVDALIAYNKSISDAITRVGIYPG